MSLLRFGLTKPRSHAVRFRATHYLSFDLRLDIHLSFDRKDSL
ncbi:hypothetical protein SEA_GILBERTA_99 [Mycobacterium phage Gilberta]|nr:hypothetical protein SEA_ET2BRUTUS_102 [Mycobacterium phage Et2Brutus]UXE03408.1 hypothetical protein SEA_GILBERTA_99 [Mycobacterium phage Gilberta]